MAKGLIIAGVVAVGIIVSGLTASHVYTDVRNTGTSKELHLTARYKTVMTKYDQDRTSIMEQLGIAAEKRDAIDTILKDAIEGRRFAGAGGAVDPKAFISAVREAYPDTSGTNIYDKILEAVQQMRKSFAADQVQLAGDVQDFNTWRKTGGLLHPWFAGMLFPDDSLEIKIGDATYHGRDALDKMSTVIMTTGSQKIFNSGKDEQLDIHQKKN